MPNPSAVIISGELAEQHANTLQGIYDMNKQGVAMGGRFLEQVQDVIRSLRGLTTQQELFAKAWEGHTELSGVLFERFMAGLTPSGDQVVAPTTR
jgi:hypothetical protein